jgi:hypothetical protein
VPSFTSPDESEKSLPVVAATTDSNFTESEPVTETPPVFPAKDEGSPPSLPPKDNEVEAEADPFQSDVKQVSIGGTVISTGKAEGDEKATANQEASVPDEVEDTPAENLSCDAPHSDAVTESVSLPETVTQPNPTKNEADTPAAMPGAFDQW